MGRASVAAARKHVPSKNHQNDHFARANYSSDGEKERSKQASLNDGLSKAEKLMMPTADSRIYKLMMPTADRLTSRIYFMCPVGKKGHIVTVVC